MYCYSVTLLHVQFNVNRRPLRRDMISSLKPTAYQEDVLAVTAVVWAVVGAVLSEGAVLPRSTDNVVKHDAKAAERVS